jgi:hypothetical protein
MPRGTVQEANRLPVRAPAWVGCPCSRGGEVPATPQPGATQPPVGVIAWKSKGSERTEAF